MKKLIAILCCLGLLPSAFPAGFRITQIITLTNSANLTNGIQFTLNGDVRTGEDIVTNSASQFARSNRVDYAMTNLFAHLAVNPFASVSLAGSTATNNIVLIGNTNLVMSGSFFGAWGNVTNVTNTVYGALPYTTPYTVESNALRVAQQNMVVTNLEYATTQWSETLVALGKYVNTNTVQPLAYKRLIAPEHYGGDFISGTFTLRDNVVFLLDGANVGNFEFYHSDSGQRWNMYPGQYADKNTNTITRYGDFFRDQFTYDLTASSATVGQLWVPPGALFTNLFLHLPEISYGFITGTTNISTMLTYQDASHIDFADTDGRQAYLDVNNIGHPQIRKDDGSAFIADPLEGTINELITYAALTNFCPIIGSGANLWGSTNTFALDSFFVGPAHFSAVRLTNTVAAIFSGPVNFNEGTYTSMTGGSNNVVQLATNTWTRISGHVSACNLNSLRFADGLPAANREVGLINGGLFNITIIDAASDGFETQATNRILTAGSYGATLYPGGAARLKYSTSNSRWELITPQPLTAVATNVAASVENITPGVTNVLDLGAATMKRSITALTTNQTLILSNITAGGRWEFFILGANGSVIASNYTIAVLTNGITTATRVTWLTNGVANTNGSYAYAVSSNKWGRLTLTAPWTTNIFARYEEGN